jgi:hypothetical protein
MEENIISEATIQQMAQDIKSMCDISQRLGIHRISDVAKAVEMLKEAQPDIQFTGVLSLANMLYFQHNEYKSTCKCTR